MEKVEEGLGRDVDFTRVLHAVVIGCVLCGCVSDCAGSCKHLTHLVLGGLSLRGDLQLLQRQCLALGQREMRLVLKELLYCLLRLEALRGLQGWDR